MSRTILEETTDNSQPRRRVDITLSQQCREQVERIIRAELQDDATHDRPPRTKSAVLEMLIRKGVKSWQLEHVQPLKG